MSKVYDYVTEQIIERIEEALKNGEVFQWTKPWTTKTVPRNFISKKTYNGINLLLLSEPGFYVSFKQLKDLQKKHTNLKLKKGCKKYMCVYWSKINVKDEDVKSGDEEKNSTRMIFKYYTLYNQRDIENFEEIIPEEFKEKEEEVLIKNEMALDFIDNFSKKVVEIENKDINRAFYNYIDDKIVVPPHINFKNHEDYYATCFHEMVHSTGYRTRLNRKIENKFGSVDYSKEELVAEIGSSMLCADFNITDRNNKDVAYLQSWLKVLKNDTKLISFAAQKSQKAVNFIKEQLA